MLTTMTDHSADEIFEQERNRLVEGCNRFIGLALILSWLGVIIAAFLLNGRTLGSGFSIHRPNTLTAIVFGLVVAGIPGLFAVCRPKNRNASYALAVGQMLLVGLLTHVTGGRIESHFAYFGSLALLTAYRDWRIVVLASAVAAVDHLLRGLYMPCSLFGSDQVQIWRVVEHASWVIWEDVFLIRSCVQSMSQMRDMATQSDMQRKSAEGSAAQVKSLLNAAQTLSEVSQTLMVSTGQLTSEATSSLGQAKNVSEQMTLVSGQVAQMDASAKDISVSVGESATCANQSDAAAVQALAEVTKLIESSRQITEVVDTVQTLVFQTNLLSINAAIEAARAGEAGETFAVVATEVRQLAVRSRESAETISRRITAIQSNVDSVGSRLSEICDSITHISSLTTVINRAAQAQASTSAGINQATMAVERSAQQMLKSMDGVYRLSEAASQAASKTSDLAVALRRMADKTEAVAVAN